MIRKTLAIAAIALGALIVAPAAANAEEAGYTGQGASVSVEPGETASLTFTGLPANTPSTATAPDAVTLGVLKASTASHPTDASGSVTYTAAASTPGGTYTITVTAGGQAVATGGTFTVEPSDAVSGSGGDSDSGLPHTGYDLPIIVIWIAVGVLLLGAAFVVVTATVRRARRDS